MSLPKCNGCHSRIQWKDVMKSYWFGYKPIQCQKCKTKHQFPLSSRITSVISQGCLLFIIFILLQYQRNVFLVVTIYLVTTFFITALFPFIFTYKTNTTIDQN
ncbi:TIGR04104 family putative zinc finger protein [Bacillus sp. JCM 19034]|uniref:TIGR04104 family putative zinc finger protein n=1 Tax=Bacillus sp. JCM 19034 TaxID=1481928 RepID=UPI0007837333|nr:TIGR04104 family putative zinc finger protein [Bacillus sp. JCM 19034]